MREAVAGVPSQLQDRASVLENEVIIRGLELSLTNPGHLDFQKVKEMESFGAECIHVPGGQCTPNSTRTETPTLEILPDLAYVPQELALHFYPL
jgi:hypothetical protein